MTWRPATPARVDGLRPVEQPAYARRLTLNSEKLTFAEETIEARGEGRLRFRCSATTFTTQAAGYAGYRLSVGHFAFRITS